MTPRGLAMRPALRDDCKGYLEVFWELSACRLIIQGVFQPIQISEIVTLLKEYEVSREERKKARHLLQQMDIAYLEKKAEKARAAVPVNKN